MVLGLLRGAYGSIKADLRVFETDLQDGWQGQAGLMRKRSVRAIYLRTDVLCAPGPKALLSRF